MNIIFYRFVVKFAEKIVLNLEKKAHSISFVVFTFAASNQLLGISYVRTVTIFRWCNVGITNIRVAMLMFECLWRGQSLCKLVKDNFTKLKLIAHRREVQMVPMSRSDYLLHNFAKNVNIFFFVF